MRGKILFLLLCSCTLIMLSSPQLHAGAGADPALLEYLGSFETGKGGGIDPMLLGELPKVKTSPKKARKPACKSKTFKLKKRKQKK